MLSLTDLSQALSCIGFVRVSGRPREHADNYFIVQFPFYFTFKVIAILWLVLPQTKVRGSAIQHLGEHLLTPLLRTGRNLGLPKGSPPSRGHLCPSPHRDLIRVVHHSVKLLGSRLLFNVNVRCVLASGQIAYLMSLHYKYRRYFTRYAARSGNHHWL